MNPDFERDGYLVVKNFIPRDSLHDICLNIKTKQMVLQTSQGLVVNILILGILIVFPFDPLLTLLTPKMNEILDLDLVPTYYYQRTYLRGGAMSHHTDRPSCQRSITMNLGYSHQWANIHSKS